MLAVQVTALGTVFQAEINVILSLPVASVPHAHCIVNVYELSVFSALTWNFLIWTLSEGNFIISSFL